MISFIPKVSFQIASIRVIWKYDRLTSKHSQSRACLDCPRDVTWPLYNTYNLDENELFTAQHGINNRNTEVFSNGDSLLEDAPWVNHPYGWLWLVKVGGIRWMRAIGRLVNEEICSGQFLVLNYYNNHRTWKKKNIELENFESKLHNEVSTVRDIGTV